MPTHRTALAFVLALLLAPALSVQPGSALAHPASDVEGAFGGGTTALLLTGVIDGPLTGGLPKAIEVYVAADVADLGRYSIGSANNGGGSDGEEFTFPNVSATAGTFLYIATESTAFENWFGFAPDYTSSAANINGDDAIELFADGVVVDVFGDIDVDGNGQPWEYEDGWAYRVDGTGPDGATFALGNWTFSGPGALDGETSNDTAEMPFPDGTYAPGMASLALTTVVDRAAAVCADPDDIETCDLAGSSSAVTAAPGEKLVVRYTAENTGDVAFSTHDLVDSADGVLLNNSPVPLPSGESVRIDNFSTAPGMAGTTTRSATWTADDGTPTEASGTDTYEITVAEPDTSCPSDLAVIDFRTSPDDAEFVDLMNVGDEPVDFAVVECALGGFRADAYVTLPLSGTLAPFERLRIGSAGAAGVDVVIPDNSLVDAYAALALLDLPELPLGTDIPTIQPVLVTSLVYLTEVPSAARAVERGARSGGVGVPPAGPGPTVFGFLAGSPAGAFAYCAAYEPAGRLHPFGRGQCMGTATRSADGAAGPPMDLASMVAEALAAEVRASGAELGATAAPAAFRLGGVYPNPVSRAASVTVEVPEAADVRVVVYDVLGRAVAVLLDGEAEAGRHTVRLDASGLAVGTYVVRMTTGGSGAGFAQSQRLTVVR